MNWLLLQNSLLVSAVTTLLAMGFGLLAALWLAAAQSRWRAVGLAAAVAALAMPPFLVTNSWLDWLGVTGVLHRWLPVNIFSLPGAVWILALLLWPITALAVWSRWERLEPELLEVEPALRGTALIGRLLLPAARTSLLVAGALTFVLALNNFAVPAILQVKVFPAQMWIDYSTNLDTLGAFKLSLPLTILPLAVLGLLARSDLSWPALRGCLPARLFHRQLGRGWRMIAGALTWLVVFLSVGVPLLQLATAGRTWVELPGAIEAGEDALWNSIWLAAVTATLCVGIALILGTPRSARRGAGRALFGASLWLPFLTPGVLIGITLIWLFDRPALTWFYASFGIVLVALGLRYFAIGRSVAAHALRTTDRDLNDAARLEGASRWQILWHVQRPQITPQLAAAWYVIYLLCLWDVESLVLIMPPGGETLALRVFNLLHYGHNAQVNALCLTLLGAAVAPLAIWLVWRWVRFLVEAGWQMANSKPAAGVALLMALALFTGCSPSGSSKSAPLQSKFFSRAIIIATRGVGVGEVNKPRSVAVDHDDNLYVVDMTGRVQKFSPDGKFLLDWQMPQITRGKPKGMGCDADGNIVVVEPHYKRINHFSPDGRLVAQWGISGTNVGQLDMPRSFVENSRHEIFVTEYGLVERIQKFTLGVSLKNAPTLNWNPHETDAQALNETRLTPAKFLACYGKPGTAPGEFNRAEGTCLDANDNLYVADSCNHRIQVLTSDGKFLREFGTPGSAPGELSYPYDVKMDPQGNLFVCEFGNSRIQVFDKNGHSLEIIGKAGAAPGEFNNPWSIALDSHGNLYVADALNHRVQKLVRRRGTSNNEHQTPNNEAARRVRGFETRAVLPHPGPLPLGEGETSTVTPPGDTLNFSMERSIFSVACIAVPSPWGEGQGEGGRKQIDSAPPVALRHVSP
jgi:ABC-type Fe3+ transport system permease subunit/DNA-binding beta-propeller fold protein YncE